MNINNNLSPNFGAKFTNSASLKLVADYAVEHGKFSKLNEARKNIDRANLQTRLRMDIAINDKDCPVVTFSRFLPKKNVTVAYNLNDYFLAESVSYESCKKMNPLKFALERIIKMGQNNAHNNMYERVVLGKK